MDRLDAPDYWLGRLLMERGLALVYLIAFLVAVAQFRPLLGARGLLPAPRFLGAVSFWQAPSLFHWRYSDRLAMGVSWSGAALAAATLAGIPQRGPEWLPVLVWLALWALYQSIVNVGQVFYGFGWESLLLEAGFLAMFLGPEDAAPLWPAILMMRWLVFRTEFGAGMIKMRGDPCWRSLTCLDYHHETQPMPNPLSWYFHNLPRPLHRVETLGNHVTQLVLPFGLFLPQPVADACAVVIILTQCWLVLSGNFSWLNLVTIVVAASGLDGALLGHLVPVSPPALRSPPGWFAVFTLAGTALVVVLSWWPARNLVRRRQAMNASFNALHLVNTYGAFGSVTRVRHEIVVEGAAGEHPRGDEDWLAYEFRGKPGDPMRRPPQLAPYHLRLDWLMWFAAMAPPGRHRWVLPLMLRLLEGDAALLRLLRRNPFPDGPPRLVRARLYVYRFSTPAERRATRAWWRRQLVGEYLPPLRLRDGGGLEPIAPR